MADDYDRPHHHYDDFTVRYPFDEHRTAYIERRINLDEPCDDDPCDLDHVVVVALDDYRRLVAAARGRHPTNHRSAADRAANPSNWCYPNCAVCRTLYPADS